MSEHIHHHDKDCSSGCNYIHGAHVDRQIHDAVRVVTAEKKLYADPEAAKNSLEHSMEKLAASVTEAGGIIGHIKASIEVTTNHIISVTDEKSVLKTMPTADIGIKFAAIAFMIDCEIFESMVKKTIDEISAKSEATDSKQTPIAEY